MSVPETPREVRAQAKYVRMSPRKARLVAEHIGQRLMDAPTFRQAGALVSVPAIRKWRISASNSAM